MIISLRHSRSGIGCGLPPAGILLWIWIWIYDLLEEGYLYRGVTP